jgi:hypothetical protein
MEKRTNWFLLAIAAWLLLLLGIFLVSPGGAQALPPAMSDAQWTVEAFHRHQWKESEYGLHKKSESGITENRVFGTTTEWRSHYSWQIEHPVLLVDICETCGLLRLHREGCVVRGDSTTQAARPLQVDAQGQIVIQGTTEHVYPERFLLTDDLHPVSEPTFGSLTLRTCVLSVSSSAGVELGCLTSENRTYLHPSVKTVCNPARFRRNMRAAVKGSSKAHHYLEACAAKLSQ